MTVTTFVLVLFLNNGGVQNINESESYASCTRNKYSYMDAYRALSKDPPLMRCIEIKK